MGSRGKQANRIVCRPHASAKQVAAAVTAIKKVCKPKQHGARAGAFVTKRRELVRLPIELGFGKRPFPRKLC